jgi:putative DNA primase/helicase
MMKISLFPHIKENKPIIFDGNGQELAKGLLNPCVPFGAVSKNDIPLWSPTIFNGKRSSSNAQYITMLVFDIDDGLTPFDSWRLFSDWAVLAHTSFSHKPNFHKYRIILPLANPVPAKEWNRASKWAFQFWADIVGRGEPDQKALKDCARIYFRYAIPFNDWASIPK